MYKTTCKITGRYYIGMHSTDNIEDGYLGSGKRLRYSIRKHGKENHEKEVLELFESRELLIEGEKKAITSEMIVDDMCMNLKSGGEGGNKGINGERLGGDNFKKVHEVYWKVEDNSKRRKNLLAEYRKINLGLGKIVPPDWNGKKHSNESKELMRKAKLGKGLSEDNSQYGTCWITNGTENKKVKKDIVIPEGWYKGRI